MPDYERMAADVVEAAKGFVTRAVAGIGKRLDEFEARLAAIPTPRDGKDGAKGVDGADGERGIPGADGQKGEPGADGKDGAPGRDGRDGLSGVQGEKGLDGINGKDGRDGFGLEDFTVTLGDDGRTMTFKFIRGDVCIERQIKIATVLDAGVFRPGTYSKGDGATWDGSWWIAQTETTDKPGTSSAWRLAAKRGRDGKDGKDGLRGLQGSPGTPGKDLTR